LPLRHLAAIGRDRSQRRHLPTWVASMRKNYLLTKPSPWVTFDAIDHIENYLRSQRRPLRAFEYGSGGSTLYWQSRQVECVSVEHDPAWYELVRERIVPERVDYRLVRPEPASGELDPSDPEAYGSADETFRRFRFDHYVRVIDAFADGHFDLVLVDGRARTSCVRHALPKVRPGGLLILDNADRAYYTARLRPELESLQRFEFPGATPALAAFSRTDIYVKPK